jgi:hypothetical protein
MYPIETVLPILESLDGNALSPAAFAAACMASGWGEPIADGIGLWEAKHPSDGTRLILDTVTEPTTVLCCLDSQDDYEPDALLKGALRRAFDQNFFACVELLRSRFPRSLGAGTCEPPYNWRFAHFQGLSSRIALEQSDYDPIMGVQLLLLLQPLPAEPARSTSAISAAW